MRQEPPGLSIWQLTAVAARPLDVVSGSTLAYGTRRLATAYTGALFRVLRASDGVSLDIGYLPDDSADWNTLDAFTAGTSFGVTIWYDQSGGGHNATSPANANAPTITPLCTIGNARSMVFASVTKGSGQVAISLDIPSGATFSGNSVSGVVLGCCPSTAHTTTLFQLNGANPLYLGFGTTSRLTLMSYMKNYSIAQRLSVSPFVMGFASGASATRVWLNESVTNFATGGASGLLAGGTLGLSSTVSAAGCQLDMAVAIFYPSDLSCTDQAALNASLYRAFGLQPQPRDVWVADGYSITQGFGSHLLQTYPRQALPMLTHPFIVYDTGGFGQQIVQRTSGFAQLAGAMYNPAAAYNIVSLACGTNDISGGRTAAQTIADTIAYNAQAHAVGFRVINCTILPRLNLTGPQEAQRQDFNAAMLAGHTGADLVIDIAADPAMGAPGATSDRSLYVDGTHPTNLGYSHLARYFAAAVNMCTEYRAVGGNPAEDPAGNTASTDAILQLCGPENAAAFMGALQNTGFSAESYRAAHPDLLASCPTTDAAMSHFLRFGVMERRRFQIDLNDWACEILRRLPVRNPDYVTQLLAALANAHSRGAGGHLHKSLPTKLRDLIALIPLGCRPLILIGDSHSNLYLRSPTRAQEWMTPVHALCSGGSAQGLANASSRSGYGKRISNLVAQLDAAPDTAHIPILFLFGQVDTEFVYTYKRARNGKRAFDRSDYEAFCRDCVNSYVAFLCSIFARQARHKVTLLSIFPPALSDEKWAEGYVNAHIISLESPGDTEALVQGIRALEIPDISTRTSAHAYYNHLLKAACMREGFIFF